MSNGSLGHRLWRRNHFILAVFASCLVSATYVYKYQPQFQLQANGSSFSDNLFHVLLEFRLTSLTLSLIQSETSIVASVNRNRRKQSNGKLMLRYHYTILCGYFNSYCWHDIPPFSLYRGAVMGIKHLHKECQTNQTKLST